MEVGPPLPAPLVLPSNRPERVGVVCFSTTPTASPSFILPICTDRVLCIAIILDTTSIIWPLEAIACVILDAARPLPPSHFPRCCGLGATRFGGRARLDPDSTCLSLSTSNATCLILPCQDLALAQMSRPPRLQGSHMLLCTPGTTNLITTASWHQGHWSSLPAIKSAPRTHAAPHRSSHQEEPWCSDA